MKILTKNSDYAIRALLYLAVKKEEFVSSRDIAAGENIPLVFLRRILPVLVRHKLIISREGAGGGVKLAIAPGKITVAGVMRMIQGDIQISECMFRKKICANRNKCVLRKKIQDIERKLIAEFEKVNLAELLA